MATLLEKSRDLLKVGCFFSSTKDLKTEVHRYNSLISRQAKQTKSKARKLLFICPSGNSCSFRVTASIPKGETKFKITVSRLDHSCGGVTKRKRGISTEIVMNMVPTSSSLVPIRGQSRQQVQSFVKNTSNIALKPGQASRIANLQRGNPNVQAVGELQYLEAHVDNLRANDPDGTYLIEVNENYVDIDGDNSRQLLWWYIALGAAKKGLWPHLHRFLLSVDATFLEGVFKGNLFLAVTKDANNQLALLAFAQYHSESTATWSKFLVQVKKVCIIDTFLSLN